MTPDPSLTFSTFVLTAGNRRARGACRALATRRAGPAPPILLCGPVASGKTHLLHALAGELQRAGRAVRPTTCENWRTEFVAALSGPGGADRLRERYAALDALLMDDLHVLAGLVATQQELARYIAPLALRGCPVVLAHGGCATWLRPLVRNVRKATAGLGVQIVRLTKPTPHETRAILASRFATVPSSIIGFASRRARDVRVAMGAVNAATARCQFPPVS